MKHAEIDALSLDMHVHLAPRLAANPIKLIELKGCLKRWSSFPACEGSLVYFQKWLDAIEEGHEAVIALATDPAEEGQVLRSCSPFCVLWESPGERIEFISLWRSNRQSNTNGV